MPAIIFLVADIKQIVYLWWELVVEGLGVGNAVKSFVDSLSIPSQVFPFLVPEHHIITNVACNHPTFLTNPTVQEDTIHTVKNVGEFKNLSFNKCNVAFYRISFTRNNICTIIYTINITIVYS